jgi:hypothetical protein
MRVERSELALWMRSTETLFLRAIVQRESPRRTR